MRDFVAALLDPNVPFLRYAFVVGIAGSVAFGMIGTFVVARRITYIAAAIAHCVLGGIGAAYYLRAAAGWQWLDPLYGALASALLAAVVIGLVSLYGREREDTVIGAVWATGMAAGAIFLQKTPGYIDASSILFGDILLISRSDLYLVLGIDLLVGVLVLLFYHKLVAVCFDDEFARLRGVPVGAYYLLLLCLTALTVVLFVRMVGIVMVIALLTLPAAIAGHFAGRVWLMMVYAVGICAVVTGSGLAASYTFDLPSGPVIILLGGALYLLVVVGRRFVRKEAISK